MAKNALAYGVLIPHELRDRFGEASEQCLTGRFPIVSIDISTDRDPCGIRQGTILRNPADDDCFANLAFRGFFSWRRGTVEVIGNQLAYYDIFSVHLNRATLMRDLLRKIDKAQSALPIIPSDFGQYVALLAPAVGISYMIVAEDEATEQRNHYPTGFYNIRPIKDAQVYIRNLISALAEKYLITTPGQG